MNENYKVLASGIDSLSLAIDIHWRHDSFANHLNKNRALSIQTAQNYSIKLSEEHEIYALIKPYGRKGHRW